MISSRSSRRMPAPQQAHGPGDGTKPFVLIVDDDAVVREGLSELLVSSGFAPTSYASTGALLDAGLPDGPCCLIVDVRMPGASGLDLQKYLSQMGDPRPIVFLTGHGDIPMSVQAMKAGAVDFLIKPVRDQTLLDAIRAALEIDADRQRRAMELKLIVRRLETLTRREHEVLQEVMEGRFNKQIAFDLGISEVTVKLHRGNAMRKMAAATIGQMIRIWENIPEAMRTRQ
jgi:FixJ family two-component response regulator